MKTASAKFRILHLSDLHLEPITTLNDDEIDFKLIAQTLSAVISDTNRNDTSLVQDLELFARDLCNANLYRSIVDMLRPHRPDKNTNFKHAVDKLKSTHSRNRRRHMIGAFEEWAKPEQEFDFTVITGDLFDRADKDKTMSDVNIKVLFTVLDELSQYSFIAYGNHDMKLRLSKNAEQIEWSHEKIGENLRLNTPEGNIYFYDAYRHTKIESNRHSDSAYAKYKCVVEAVINQYIDESENTFKAISDLEKDIFIYLNDLFGNCIGEKKDANYKMADFEGVSLFTTGVRKLSENIAIVILNSAWLNVDSQQCHGHLIVGKTILKAIVNQLKAIGFINADTGQSIDGKLVVTLLHNDFNWHSISDHHYNGLDDVEGIHGRSPIQTIVDFSDIILCGHEHKETPPTLLALNSYILKVGGTFRTQDLFTDNTFSIYNIDFAFSTLSRDVYCYRFDDNTNRWKWVLDVTDDFVTELKPKDAKEKFKTPHRSVDECFDILVRNNLLPADKPSKLNMDYTEYMDKYF